MSTHKTAGRGLGVEENRAECAMNLALFWPGAKSTDWGKTRRIEPTTDRRCLARSANLLGAK